jgi:hypothetical protein
LTVPESHWWNAAAKQAGWKIFWGSILVIGFVLIRTPLGNTFLKWLGFE